MSATSPSASRRWLYGPLPDLVLGAGLWYIVMLAVFAVWGPEIRRGWGPILAPLLVLVTGTPHHGATLLRVYASRSDRQRYAIYAIWISALIWSAFAIGVHDVRVGSWIITIFLTWSPWHYTGQNYGVSVMFLRRRGVPLTQTVERLLYATFILSYLLTIVSMHASGAATDFVPVVDGHDGYRFYLLPIPKVGLVFALVSAAYLGCLGICCAVLLRHARLRDLAPALLTTLSQALWFSAPVLLRFFGLRTGLDVWDASDTAYYFLWVAAAHSIQYLWVTSYYARSAGAWSGQLRYYGMAFLAGAFVWTVPALVFAPGLLGRVPWSLGLGGLVAACVNIQHFVLDGAIWKRRDSRVASILMRPSDEQTAAEEHQRRRWLAPAVHAVGALCICVMLIFNWEQYFGVRIGFAMGDLPRVESALDRLGWIGRDDPKARALLGHRLGARGEDDEARAAYERALALTPRAEAWQGIGRLEAKAGRWAEALAAYESALALAPGDPTALHDVGEARLEQGDAAGAIPLLERALEQVPDRRETDQLLRRARREQAAG